MTKEIDDILRDVEKVRVVRGPCPNAREAVRTDVVYLPAEGITMKDIADAFSARRHRALGLKNRSGRPFGW